MAVCCSAAVWWPRRPSKSSHRAWSADRRVRVLVPEGCRLAAGESAHANPPSGHTPGPGHRALTTRSTPPSGDDPSGVPGLIINI